VPFATDYTKQDKYLEIQISDFVHLAGEFSIFLLAKPVPQAQDWDYFGQSVSYFRHRVADNYLQLRVPGYFVYRVTPNNSVVLNQWQLIEIHRDVLDKITVYINGIDKTNSPNIILPGTFTVGYLLSAFKTNSQLGEAKSMHGDIASFLIYDKKTSISENNNIRNYVDDEYFAGMGVLNVNTANKQYFRVYPNPIEENIKVSISRKEFETLNVNEFPIFYDVLGKEIRTFVSKFDDHDTITFNIRFAQELNNGFYIMHLGNEVYKLLKN
jgi:hypothetical protein